MVREVAMKLPKVMPAGWRKAELRTETLEVNLHRERKIGRAYGKIAKSWIVNTVRPLRKFPLYLLRIYERL
jgi:hypothetical protein